MPGLIGTDPTHAVTFTDNHDTARDDKFGSTDQIIMGYAYLFTHPGTPCVFWSDWNTASIQTALNTFLSIRKTYGITNTASMYVEQHRGGLYAATMNGKVAMKLGTDSWSPSDSSYKLVTSGNQYAIWAK